MTENFWNGESRLNPSAASTGSVLEHATIGPSVLIKGDVSGTEPLFINGAVEGSINFPEHRVTVGRSSRIQAEIRAFEVVVMGSVEGNIYCVDLLDIRAGSVITGKMVAKRIRIDDGATLKGSVEVHSKKQVAEVEEAVEVGNGESTNPRQTKPVAPEEEFQATLREAAAAVSVAGGQPARRVPGSRTLIEPKR